MSFQNLSLKSAIILSILLLTVGFGLGIWLLTHQPATEAVKAETALLLETAQPTPAPTATPSLTASPTATELPTPTPTATAVPVVIGVADGLPSVLTTAINQIALSNTVIYTAAADAASVNLRFDLDARNGQPIFQYTFAAATRFDTIYPTITWATLQDAWRGKTALFQEVAVITTTLPALQQVLGKAGITVKGVATAEDLVAEAWGVTPTLVILPFEQLVPRLVVFSIDGQNPVENARKFSPSAYPLATAVYTHLVGAPNTTQRQAVHRILQQLPHGNRDSQRLTVIAMTGVTAMVRLMAEQMDQRGDAWPAEVVGPELSTADITAISNEVPFVPGCETNTNMDNLTFCSKPEYMETLKLSGVDIIGLTGNHQNDYGREDALTSLKIYEEAKLPVYGGGVNREAAYAPLYIEHKGNRLAFLGANSYGPEFAWATDSLPGSAQFDLATMSATIRAIKEQGLADVVLAELQYQESYDTTPLQDQRNDFNALIRAGADIVTGVQSHVPQAMEFTDEKLILYGLGNLYFDQMWSQTTREGMVVKHTIYAGRHISTQVLTTLLFDYGQPRWTTPTERKAILERVFEASVWE